MEELQAVNIGGVGGMLRPMESGYWKLESRDHHGALLEMKSPREWILKEGTLEVGMYGVRPPVKVWIDGAQVEISGDVFLSAAADLESSVSVYSGKAVVRTSAHGNRRASTPQTLNALDAIRFSNGEDQGVLEKLMPPPLVAKPPAEISPPFVLNVEIPDERIEAGAILLEYGTRSNFWISADRHLFLPGETVMLSDTGAVYIRLRAVNRSGRAGPPTKIFQVRMHTAAPAFLAPDVSAGDFFQSFPINGRIDLPAAGAVVRWNGLRTTTDTGGNFEIRPDLPFGIWVDDLCVEMAGLTHCIPLAYVSDPDSLTRWMPAENVQNPSTLFIRAPFVAFRNRSSLVQAFLDDAPMPETATQISAPMAVQRKMIFQSPDRVLPTMSIMNDTQGPKILDVRLGSRGDATLFYVSADVVDLGVGVALPARAVFENEVGERLEVTLQRVAGIRLEGRPAAGDWQNVRNIRSRVWWVRVEVEDLLGNGSKFEQAVFRKRNKKFLSLGLKDLVQVWKNKI